VRAVLAATVAQATIGTPLLPLHQARHHQTDAPAWKWNAILGFVEERLRCIFRDVSNPSRTNALSSSHPLRPPTGLVGLWQLGKLRKPDKHVVMRLARLGPLDHPNEWTACDLFCKDRPRGGRCYVPRRGGKLAAGALNRLRRRPDLSTGWGRSGGISAPTATSNQLRRIPIKKKIADSFLATTHSSTRKRVSRSSRCVYVVGSCSASFCASQVSSIAPQRASCFRRTGRGRWLTDSSCHRRTALVRIMYSKH
jgi:hypothetical protein